MTHPAKNVSRTTYASDYDVLSRTSSNAAHLGMTLSCERANRIVRVRTCRRYMVAFEYGVGLANRAWGDYV